MYHVVLWWKNSYKTGIQNAVLAFQWELALPGGFDAAEMLSLRLHWSVLLQVVYSVKGEIAIMVGGFAWSLELDNAGKAGGRKCVLLSHGYFLGEGGGGKSLSIAGFLL